MAEKLTAQQLQAVTDRGGNLLVSAAAGSGKTKVLVDRLMSYLTDPVNPANLDNFLIITYTKAAAAELRGKIASKLSERIAEDPTNRHLQQQMQRLYLTKISTVHAFCTDILREYAYQLELSSDFRVADENEVVELQGRALQQVLDQAYEKADEDPDFCRFIDSQGFGRDDSMIPEIILKVYHTANCHLDPAGWLDWCVSVSADTEVEDAAQTVWGAYLLADMQSYVALQIEAMNRCVQRATAAVGMDKVVLLLNETVDQLVVLRNCKTWDDVLRHGDIDYGRLTIPKTVTDIGLAEQIKSIRDACKKGIAKKLRRFTDSSDQILSDLNECLPTARGLVALTKEFGNLYTAMKRKRRVLDFGDLEHKMLDLLLGKKRSGPTIIADEIGQRFREVMVDEYQDSNAVQDAIFTALTYKRKNCFMVGDVKQSIYQFRLADPGIFLEKYHRFIPADDATIGQDRKVILSKNFRSAGSVIRAVNDVFSACMSPEVGGLYYGQEEQLCEGIEHLPSNEREVELLAIDVQEDTYAEEAAFVADKISNLLDGTHMVRQGDTFRPIKAEDIVILLRSPGSVGAEFQYALEQRRIRCSTGAGVDLLQTEEVETLRALLSVISNPLQDIPLIAVLSSRVFGFTADDLAQMRSGNKNVSMYDALLRYPTAKSEDFLNMLSILRKEARMNSLSGLLRSIFALTRIDTVYSVLDDGAIRVENLQSFCSMVEAYEQCGNASLSRFLAYLDSLEERGLAASDRQSEADAVTIMSIHKSKGLEFPVVFLCGLSREFNRESARAQVLCDNSLGLGVVCVDERNRVRYPTIAKRAIAAKMIAESISEEMRVLYVAMTRARDRLIMTYAQKNVAQKIDEISMRMELSDTLLLTGEADCPGLWVLYTALKKRDSGWNIEIEQVSATEGQCQNNQGSEKMAEQSDISEIVQMLSFRYAHSEATSIPSKQTATQLKGRMKDSEAAEFAAQATPSLRRWGKPSQGYGLDHGTNYGDMIHRVMQHIKYENCSDHAGVFQELIRLRNHGILTEEQFSVLRIDELAAFFDSDIGRKLQTAKNVLREFKFSVLEDAAVYYDNVHNERILLQGVVDCAVIEEDGITVLDFKSDQVTEETLDTVARGYIGQVKAYANALERIYQLPIKSAQLYFFSLNRFVSV